ncbi:MAG: hypothetical protein AB4352_23330 [Hormoscilla sp.]
MRSVMMLIVLQRPRTTTGVAIGTPPIPSCLKTREAPAERERSEDSVNGEKPIKGDEKSYI